MATVNRAFRVKNGLNVEGAELRPAAGTTTYPPILLTSGTNLTTATAGAFEYDGTNFYLTASTGGRKTIAFTDMAVSAATSSALGTIKLGSDTTNTATAASVGSTNGRTYLTQFNASQQLVVNVPWTDTVYTLPTATATALGGVELFSATTQTTAANAVTTTASRTYGLQLNSDLQGVINVPWTDNNFYPTALTYAGGTTAGPVATLAMTGASNIVADAIPSAAVGASGIVTTGAQEFGGTKTLTSPAITTSLTTGSTTFALVNTTATTVNFAGAGTAVNIGASSGNTTVNNNLVVTGNLTVNGTTTTVNSTTITVDDILLELGAVTTPTDVTAEGGGIRVLGATSKDIKWTGTGSNFASTENFDLATGKVYKINNTSVLSATALGSAVVGSSLTSVGTITTGTWNGTLIAGQYGGTGVNNSGKTITIGGNFTTSGAHTTTLTTTGNTSITLPTSGTVISNPVSVSGAGTAVALTGGATTGTTSETGGAVTITGGASTSGTAENTGGAVSITGGAANTTAGYGGSVTINGGLGNSGSLGSVSIGTTNTDKVTIGAAGTNLVGPKPLVVGGTSGASIVTSAGSTTGTTALTLTSLYSTASFDGGEFVIKATNSTNIEILKVLVITNGTDTYMTTYGDVWVSSDLVNVDFSYTGSLVNIVVTPVAGTSGTTTVKVTGTLLAK